MNKKFIKGKPCLICGRPEVDVCHIKSRGAGGGDEIWNLFPACRLCHSLQHSIGILEFSKRFPLFKSYLKTNGWEFLTTNKLVRANMEQEIKESNKKYGVIRSESVGTENYWRGSPVFRNFYVTDGIKLMAQEYEADWFVDLVASYMFRIPLLDQKFMSLHIIKDLDASSKGNFYLTDGSYNVLISQEIPYTDLEQNICAYLQPDGKGHYILMMPSEY